MNPISSVKALRSTSPIYGLPNPKRGLRYHPLQPGGRAGEKRRLEEAVTELRRPLRVPLPWPKPMWTWAESIFSRVIWKTASA